MDHPVRGWFNAWLLDVLDGYMHRKYGSLKARLFGPVPATVVDLGAGSGANFRYFPPRTRVVAVEPNRGAVARGYGPPCACRRAEGGQGTMGDYALGHLRRARSTMKCSRLIRIALCLGAVIPGVVGAQQKRERPAPAIDDARAPQYFAVVVNDAEVSAAWYEKLFGLRELDRSQAPDGSWQIINLTSPALLVEIIRDSREPASSRGRGFAKVGFAVHDVSVASVAIGRVTGTAPRVLEFPRQGIRLVQVRDPDGNIIQLSSPLRPSACSRPATSAVALVELPGQPFQAVPTADGCYVFVSLAGPVEPGDPRRPPRPGAGPGGVALVDRTSGEPRLVRVLTLEGSPYGMVLTHDGRMLVVASDDRVAFVDAARLITGAPDPLLGYLRDAPLAGRFYANVTRDDRWLFVSDESERSISVIDLVRARASSFDDGAVVGRIPTGRAPIALAFSPDDRLLYATSQEAPASFGWPAACRAPGSDTTRFQGRYPAGVVMVIDVARATREPARAVLGAVAAGCNPVRLATSPRGDIAYVTARTDNQLLAYDTSRLLSDSAHALIGRVPVGSTPVGVTTLRDGRWIAVTNSNRFGASTTPPSMTLIDAHRVADGEAAVLGTLQTGAFPRELSVTSDQRTLLLTNFDSKTLAVIDVARMSAGVAPPR